VSIETIYRELNEWLIDSEDKVLRSPLSYHLAYLQKLRGQLAQIMGRDVQETDVAATSFIERTRAKAAGGGGK
jgi:hypothetical protein